MQLRGQFVALVVTNGRGCAGNNQGSFINFLFVRASVNGFISKCV